MPRRKKALKRKRDKKRKLTVMQRQENGSVQRKAGTKKGSREILALRVYGKKTSH